MVLRSRFFIAALGGAATFLATHTSNALNEQWYGKFSCQPATGASQTSWGLNGFGYYNSSTTSYLNLRCEQPHLLGNNGYNGAEAVIYARHPTQPFVMEFCRGNTDGSSEACDTFSTTGPVGPVTVTFGANGDNTRSYYYWRADLPPYTTLSSHLTTVFFKDN